MEWGLFPNFEPEFFHANLLNCTIPTWQSKDQIVWKCKTDVNPNPKFSDLSDRKAFGQSGRYPMYKENRMLKLFHHFII